MRTQITIVSSSEDKRVNLHRHLCNAVGELFSDMNAGEYGDTICILICQVFEGKTQRIDYRRKVKADLVFTSTTLIAKLAKVESAYNELKANEDLLSNQSTIA